MMVQGTLVCGIKESFNKILGFIVVKRLLTLKALIATAPKNTLKYFFRENNA